MERLVWLTDTHIDQLTPAEIDGLLTLIAAEDPDYVLLTGDISEGSRIADDLRRLAAGIQRPLYFVLGNHDYYDRSIAATRALMRQMSDNIPDLHYLPDSNVVELTPQVALVGHDGWSDGRYGDFLGSSVVLGDYHRIDDLKNLTNGERFEKLKALGDEAAAHLRTVLPAALDRYQRVLVAMHPPPFQEDCYYLDQPASDDNEYLPHFACKAVGDVLLEIAPGYPGKAITVLAGHTHHAAQNQMLDNLEVIVRPAEYRVLQIAQVFEL